MHKIIRLFLRPVWLIYRNLGFFIKRFVLNVAGVSIAQGVSVSLSASVDPARGSIVIGKNSSIDKGCIIRAFGGKITIGQNCTLNPYCVLYGPGEINIGDGVRIAPHVVIVAANHVFSDPNEFIFEQGLSKNGVVILDDVWIGAGARILDGVQLAHGTVVAAGAVVTKSTKAYDIVAGVPARKISSRHASPNTN